MQPIETYRGGYRFRSRLEARWSLIFDSLGLRWEYEPQGYRIGPRRRPYLPDFYLTDLGWWVEVKGSADRLDHALLLDAVHPDHGLGRPDPFNMLNLLILGDIPRWDRPSAHFGISRSITPQAGCPDDCALAGPRYGLYYFAPIPDTIPDFVAQKHGLDLEQHARLRRMGALLQPAARTSLRVPSGDLTEALPLPGAPAMPRLVAAYLLGRTARFEHGEAA